LPYKERYSIFITNKDKTDNHGPEQSDNQYLSDAQERKSICNLGLTQPDGNNTNISYSPQMTSFLLNKCNEIPSRINNEQNDLEPSQMRNQTNNSNS
jgi:hypothetical protein